MGIIASNSGFRDVAKTGTVQNRKVKSGAARRYVGENVRYQFFSLGGEHGADHD